MASPGRGPRIPALVAVIALVIADVVGVVVVHRDTRTNGEDKKLPAAIVTDAINATVAAEPVRVHGTGEIDPNSRTSVDLVFSQQASGGTFLASGQPVSIVTTPTETYVKGEAALIRQILGKRTPASLTVSSWVEASHGDPEFAVFGAIGNLSTFLEALTTERYIAGKVTRYQGHRAVPLVSVSTPGEIVYLSATGSPVLLAITAKGQAGTSTITFDSYGTAAPPAVPTTTIDLDKLLESGGAG